jgi:hypothetical protein
MESSLRVMRTVRMVMLIAAVLYVFIGERTPHTLRPTNLIFYYAITGVAIAMILLIFFFRRVTILRSERTLVQSEISVQSLYLWRLGHIATFALSGAVALVGFVLRFVGFSLSETAPFYLAGIVLLLIFNPRPSSAAQL